MNNIDSARSKFFPSSKIENAQKKNIQRAKNPFIQSNDSQRKTEIEKLTAKDAKVSIPSAVKDFAKIRKAVDMAPEIDNSAKIAKLKSQIQAGTYSIDYDALADKMLAAEH
jgi:negative regulator of flagellin synthesis FlgM